MEYTTLNNGVRMPMLGFGVWQWRRANYRSTRWVRSLRREKSAMTAETGAARRSRLGRGGLVTDAAFGGGIT